MALAKNAKRVPYAEQCLTYFIEPNNTSVFAVFITSAFVLNVLPPTRHRCLLCYGCESKSEVGYLLSRIVN